MAKRMPREKAPFCVRSGRIVHVLPRNLKWPATAFVQFAFRLSFRGKIVSIYEMLQAKPAIALAPKTALNTGLGDAGQDSGNAGPGIHPVIRRSRVKQRKKIPRPGELCRRGGVGLTEAWH